MTVEVKVQYNISIEQKETKQMTLINELESNTSKVYTLTDKEIYQALRYYNKAGYDFDVPDTRRDQLSLISDITYVSSKNRKELQEALRYLQSKSGQYKINLRKSTDELRSFLFKTTCRFSAETPITNLTRLAVVYSLNRQELQTELKKLRSNPGFSEYLQGVRLNQKTIKLRELLANLTF